jgi:photosystem II stability/assembly factor-like uncharacterized protein
MKKAIALALLFSVWAGLPAGADWTEQYFVPSDDLFMNCHAVSDQIAFACGMTDVPPAQGAAIFGTYDGGQTWRFLGPPGFSFFFANITFPTDTVGYASGMDIRPALQGSVYKTVDQGSSWQQMSMPQDTFFNALQGLDFVDTNTGWVGGNEGLVMRTTDGGQSWTRLPFPVSNIQVDGIDFLDDQVGWATGGTFDSRARSGPLALYPFQFLRYQPRAVYGGAIAHSTDGGNSWQLQLRDAPAHLHDICFTDPLHGVCVGEKDNEAALYVTFDGGRNWQERPIPQHSRFGTIGILNAVDFTDRLNGWAVGGTIAATGIFNAILRTTDGGLTWTTDESYNNQTPLFGVSFPPGRGDVGWAAGMYLTILRYDRTFTGPDTDPPYTVNHDPAPDSRDAPLDTAISVDVKDIQDGVDQSTLALRVNGVLVQPDITPVFEGFNLTWQPPAPFNVGDVVRVAVDACDLASPPNCMVTDQYQFTVGLSHDSKPPVIVDFSPPDNATNVPINEPITFTIRDDIAGVDRETLRIIIDGTIYDLNSSVFLVQGTPRQYVATLYPPAGLWPVNKQITWFPRGCDLAPTANCLTPLARTFRTGAQARPARVALGGYMATRLTAAGGTLHLAALVTDRGVNGVELYFNGYPTGVYLRDDGFAGDNLAGDGFYHYVLPLGGSLPPGRLTLEYFPEAGIQGGQLWPYLNVR